MRTTFVPTRATTSPEFVAATAAGPPEVKCASTLTWTSFPLAAYADATSGSTSSPTTTAMLRADLIDSPPLAVRQPRPGRARRAQAANPLSPRVAESSVAPARVGGVRPGWHVAHGSGRVQCHRCANE